MTLSLQLEEVEANVFRINMATAELQSIFEEQLAEMEANEIPLSERAFQVQSSVDTAISSVSGLRDSGLLSNGQSKKVAGAAVGIALATAVIDVAHGILSKRSLKKKRRALFDNAKQKFQQEAVELKMLLAVVERSLALPSFSVGALSLRLEGLGVWGEGYSGVLEALLRRIEAETHAARGRSLLEAVDALVQSSSAEEEDVALVAIGRIAMTPTGIRERWMALESIRSREGAGAVRSVAGNLEGCLTSPRPKDSKADHELLVKARRVALATPDVDSRLARKLRREAAQEYLLMRLKAVTSTSARAACGRMLVDLNLYEVERRIRVWVSNALLVLSIGSVLVVSTEIGSRFAEWFGLSQRVDSSFLGIPVSGLMQPFLLPSGRGSLFWALKVAGAVLLVPIYKRMWAERSRWILDSSSPHLESHPWLAVAFTVLAGLASALFVVL